MADTIGNNCPHLKEFAGSHLVHDDEQNNEIKYSIHEKLHHVLQLRCHLSREMNAVLNDDDCLRFLVARSFVIKDTIEMIDRWTKWFQTPTLAIFDAKHQRFINCSPKEILDLPDPKEDVYSRLYPHSNLGCDKYGRPIYWEKIGIGESN
jgi:hypothetical protein